MESYLDGSNSKHWFKVFEIMDNGGWYASSVDKVYYSVNCGSKDHTVLNSIHIVIFRADNVALNFKNLSIREIETSIKMIEGWIIRDIIITWRKQILSKT